MLPPFDVSSVLDAAVIEQSPDRLKTAISAMYCTDESRLLEALIPLAKPTPALLDKATRESAELVEAVRARFPRVTQAREMEAARERAISQELER